MTDGPLLWYLNRATGVVLLVMLTLSVALGVLAMGVRPGGRVPRFVSQSLHRDVALLAVLSLAGHVASAVVDTYVDIRWWQALVPAGGTYEPVWLGLGALSLDLLALVVATSLLRARLDHRSWRAVHVLSWLAWGVAVVHSIGMGTDLRARGGVAVLPVAVCVGAVLLTLVVRFTPTVRRPRSAIRRGA